MHPAGVGRGLHAELARRVAAEHVALEHPVADDVPIRGRDPLAVVGRTADGAAQMRLLVDAHVGREDGLADGVHQEARLAVEIAPADRGEKVPEEAGGDVGGE